MSDLIINNQTGEPKWFTNKEIAEVFGCDEGNIRKHKFLHKADFTYGIDWIYEKDLTNVGGVTESNTGQMFSGNDGDSPTLWSRSGIIKLAVYMKKTEKAIEFTDKIRDEEAEKRVLAKILPQLQTIQTQIQELKNENLALKEQSQKALNYSAEAKMDSYATKNEIHHNLGDIQKSINDLRDDFKWGESPLMTVGEFCKVYRIEYITGDQKMEIGKWCTIFTRREGNEVAEEKIPGGHIKLYRLNILIWTVFKFLNYASYEQTIKDIYKFNREN